MTVVCGAEGGNSRLDLHPNEFLHSRTLTGAFLGGIKPKTDLPRLVDMYMNKVSLSLSL